MPTISSMVRSTYLMYKYNQKNGGNIFHSSSNSINNISSLWNNYSAFSSSSAANSTLSGLIGIRSSLNDMMNNYNTTKKTFDMELSDTLSDLKKSIDNVKQLDFKFGADDLKITETLNEDGTTTTTSTKSDKLTEALKGVEDFVNNYNDTIKFFSDNADVSKRVKNMAMIFSDTTYNSKSAANIGIKIVSDGKMIIDEDALVKAMTENSTRVDAVLSTLTNKADRHVSFAKSQQSLMFPTMNSMMGSSLKSASVYSGNSLMRISSYASTGNLLNFFI